MKSDGIVDHPWFSPVCSYCRHLDIGQWHKCEAYPDAIPWTIWDGENNHTDPFPGDHGIRFEPAHGLEEAEGEGHWITHDGRHIFIGGPRPAGTEEPADIRANISTVADYENTIVDKKTEYSAAYGSGGAMIFTDLTDGENFSVNLDAYSGKLRDATLTHNHPLEQGFSNNDFKVAVREGLKQMRAVTPKYLHVLDMHRNFERDDELDYDMRKSIFAQYEWEIDRGFRIAAVKVSNGETLPIDNEGEIVHATWTNLAKTEADLMAEKGKRPRWTYRREKR